VRYPMRFPKEKKKKVEPAALYVIQPQPLSHQSGQAPGA